MVNFKVDDLKNMKSELKAFSDFLRASGCNEDEIFAGKLVSCELITNVIRHGMEEAEFTGALTGDRIIITVTAESLKDVDFCRTAPDVFAESGRGLYIVKSICNGKIERGEDGEIKAVILRRKQQ